MHDPLGYSIGDIERLTRASFYTGQGDDLGSLYKLGRIGFDNIPEKSMASIKEKVYGERGIYHRLRLDPSNFRTARERAGLVHELINIGFTEEEIKKRAELLSAYLHFKSDNNFVLREQACRGLLKMAVPYADAKFYSLSNYNDLKDTVTELAMKLLEVYVKCDRSVQSRVIMILRILSKDDVTAENMVLTSINSRVKNKFDYVKIIGCMNRLSNNDIDYIMLNLVDEDIRDLLVQILNNQSANGNLYAAQKIINFIGNKDKDVNLRLEFVRALPGLLLRYKDDVRMKYVDLMGLRERELSLKFVAAEMLKQFSKEKNLDSGVKIILTNAAEAIRLGKSFEDFTGTTKKVSASA